MATGKPRALSKAQPAVALFDEERVQGEHGKPLRLHSRDEVPVFMQRRFILGGYRLYLTSAECAKSLLQMHNESWNCWTHLGGFFFFLYLAIGLGDRLVSVDFAAVDGFLVCCMFCLLSSTLYHMLNCHSHRVYMRFFKLDLCGISSQIFGSFLTGVRYGFRCVPFWRDLYMVGVVAMCLVGILAPWTAWLHKPVNEKFRIGLYVTMVASGLVPAIHWFAIAHADEARIFVPYLCWMFGLYFVGLVFYLSCIPERFFPGRLDCSPFSSHSIWHIAILGAAYSWYVGSLRLAEYAVEHPCQPLPVS